MILTFRTIYLMLTGESSQVRNEEEIKKQLDVGCLFVVLELGV
jgi:hypothetical protein